MYIFFCITYKTFFVSTEIAFSSKALAVQTKGAVALFKGYCATAGPALQLKCFPQHQRLLTSKNRLPISLCPPKFFLLSIHLEPLQSGNRP